ncbi:hypothetical protein DIPPA_00825 [Diplonema papillatum]|nr:hypothetical protein DIPPA_00825 [Diplonema papillatum]
MLHADGMLHAPLHGSPGHGSAAAAVAAAEDVLSEHLRQAAFERDHLKMVVNQLQQDLTSTSQKLADEEAAHALALRQGQESLARSRQAHERQIDEAMAQLNSFKAQIQMERESHAGRMRQREAEHIANLQAERQLGVERLAETQNDTHSAVSVVQEQVYEMKKALADERHVSREAAEKIIELQKLVQKLRDEAEAQRAAHAKRLHGVSIVENSLRTSLAAAEETMEEHASEMGNTRHTQSVLEARIRDLQQALAVEQDYRTAAETRCIKAESIVQQSAQTLTASELRALDSQREVTLRGHELSSIEQALALEKERRIVLEGQLSIEMQARRSAEDRLAVKEQVAQLSMAPQPRYDPLPAYPVGGGGGGGFNLMTSALSDNYSLREKSRSRPLAPPPGPPFAPFLDRPLHLAGALLPQQPQAQQQQQRAETLDAALNLNSSTTTSIPAVNGNHAQNRDASEQRANPPPHPNFPHKTVATPQKWAPAANLPGVASRSVSRQSVSLQ